MTDLLQIILAKGDGGWVQLLIPIVVVVLYVVSGLAKLKRGQEEEAFELEKRERPIPGVAGKLRYKSLDKATDAKRPAAPRSVQQRAQQLPYAKPSAQPAAQRRQAPQRPPQPTKPRPVAPGPQPRARSRPVQARREGQIQVPRPRTRPAPARAAAARPRPKHRHVEPKPAPKVAQKLRQPQKAAATTVKPPAEVALKPRTLRTDLSGSSNLQRAIIYSEILGKPLALRDM
jgi:hypothetical protein